MKLHATITSERGKPVTKSGNEQIFCEILDGNRDILLTVHVTVANSHLRGEHKNIYISNPQSEYLAITNGN